MQSTDNYPHLARFCFLKFSFHYSPITIRERNDGQMTRPAFKWQTGCLKDKYVFKPSIHKVLQGSVNTIIIIRLIPYKSNAFGFKYFYKYKDKQTRLSLPQRSLSSTVDSKTDEYLSELSRTQRTVQ